MNDYLWPILFSLAVQAALKHRQWLTYGAAELVVRAQDSSIIRPYEHSLHTVTSYRNVFSVDGTRCRIVQVSFVSLSRASMKQQGFEGGLHPPGAQEKDPCYPCFLFIPVGKTFAVSLVRVQGVYVGRQ
jgi:hypothetical protein